MGGHRESKVQSFWSFPGQGKTPRFLGRETLEKPDNDLSIAPHRYVDKGLGASRPKVFNLVTKHFRKSSTTLRPGFSRAYFRHRLKVRTFRTHRSSSALARARWVS